MAQVSDIKTFNKGMNKDVDPRFLQQGEYIHAENLINNNHADGRVGALTNLPGIHDWADNEFIDVWSGDTVVHLLGDNQNDDLYIFISSVSGIDRIVRFDLISETFEVVVATNDLGFSTLGRTFSSAISSGIIFWTDFFGEILMFDQNIDYLSMLGYSEFDDSGITYEDTTPGPQDFVKYNNIVYKCVTDVTDSSLSAQQPTGTMLDTAYWEVADNDDITEQMLTLAKPVPQQQPDISVLTDTTYKSNNILGKFFQFKYRFIFANNQKSVFSPNSNVAFSRNDYASPESVSDNAATSNAIDIILTGKGVNDLVTKVEIAARSGNNGDFFSIKILDVDSTFLAGGEQTHRFFNEGLYDPIDLQESNQIYDDIPWNVKTLEFINNRLILGDGVSGFDKITVDYDVVPQYDLGLAPAVTTSNTDGEADPRAILTGSSSALSTYMAAAPFSYSTLVPGDKIRIKGRDISGGGDDLYQVPFGDFTVTVMEDSTWATIHAEFLAVPFDHPTDPEGDEMSSFIDSDLVASPTAGNDAFEVSLEQGQHVKTCKSGAWYNVGLQYFDQYGRTNGALTKTDSKVYIKTIGERDTTLGSYVLSEVGPVKLNVIIKNEAPSWASYYKIVYSRANVYDSSIQVATRGAANDGDNVSVDIGSIVDWNTDKGGKLAYAWEKGDIIRLITSGTTTPASPQWADGLIEAEILSTDPTGGVTTGGVSITVPPINGLSQANTVTALNGGAIIEIFRPSKELTEEDTIYSEASMFYEVYESGGSYYHRGDTDQTGVADAEVIIEGDAYLKTREDFPYGVAAASGDTIFESYAISDYRDSDHYDKGRPTAIINQEESRKFATLMYSEVLIPNTDINNLNRFYPDINYEEYNKSFGNIVHLFNEGDHLLMLQQDKVSKVYVDRSVIYDAQGNAQLLGTEAAVLSQSVPYAGQYGIQSAGSFQSSRNARYWADPYRGVILRLSASGIDEISKYGMKGYFADASREILTYTVPGVYSVFDVFHNTYMISMTGMGEVMLFNEESNTWTGAVKRFFPRDSVYINNRVFVNTSSAVIYELNYAGINRNTIDDGTPVASYIQFDSNIEPVELKNYLALAIDGSHALDVDITTEAIGGGTDQESTLDRSLDFRQREQEWHAAFLRDKKTPDFASEPEALLAGDTIKGKDAKITLTLPVAVADEDFVLKLVKVIVSKG